MATHGGVIAANVLGKVPVTALQSLRMLKGGQDGAADVVRCAPRAGSVMLLVRPVAEPLGVSLRALAEVRFDLLASKRLMPKA